MTEDEIGAGNQDENAYLVIKFINNHIPFFSIAFVCYSSIITVIYTYFYIGPFNAAFLSLLDTGDIFRYFFVLFPWVSIVVGVSFFTARYWKKVENATGRAVQFCLVVIIIYFIVICVSQGGLSFSAVGGALFLGMSMISGASLVFGLNIMMVSFEEHGIGVYCFGMATIGLSFAACLGLLVGNYERLSISQCYDFKLKNNMEEAGVKMLMPLTRGIIVRQKNAQIRFISNDSVETFVQAPCK